MMGATAIAVGLRCPWPILIVGEGLLAGLVVVAWRRWTSGGEFGWANGVTALRAGLLGLFPGAAAVEPEAVIGMSLLVVAGDGADGWLARRTNSATPFGAFFDKETDALFLLLLCAIAAFRARLSGWILGVGLLRYAFVGLVFWLDPPEKTEERSNLARYVYAGMVAALLLAFLPYPAVYRPVVGLAAGALVVSFGRSLWRIVPRQRAFGGS